MRSKVNANNEFLSAVQHFDITVSEATTGTKMKDFNDLFSLVETRLAMPLNVRQTNAAE